MSAASAAPLSDPPPGGNPDQPSGGAPAVVAETVARAIFNGSRMVPVSLPPEGASAVPPGAYQTRSGWRWLVMAALSGVVGVAATLAVITRGFQAVDTIPKADWWNWAVGIAGGATVGLAAEATWRRTHPLAQAEDLPNAQPSQEGLGAAALPSGLHAASSPTPSEIGRAHV